MKGRRDKANGKWQNIKWAELLLYKESVTTNSLYILSTAGNWWFSYHLKVVTSETGQSWQLVMPFLTNFFTEHGIWKLSRWFSDQPLNLSELPTKIMVGPNSLVACVTVVVDRFWSLFSIDGQSEFPPAIVSVGKE